LTEEFEIFALLEIFWGVRALEFGYIVRDQLVKGGQSLAKSQNFHSSAASELIIGLFCNGMKITCSLEKYQK
jgi:hypothetical protein